MANDDQGSFIVICYLSSSIRSKIKNRRCARVNDLDKNHRIIIIEQEYMIFNKK